LSGVIVLGIVALRGVGLALAALYWHFVGAVWVVLYVSVYLI
jgi:heme/copper-type cytochrome/quinol oxidase subunit 3